MNDNDTVQSNKEAQDASAWKGFQIETNIWSGRVSNQQQWQTALSHFRDAFTEDDLLDNLRVGLSSTPVPVFRISTELDGMPSLRSFFSRHGMRPIGWTVWLVPPRLAVGVLPIPASLAEPLRLAEHCTAQTASGLVAAALQCGSRCWAQAPDGQHHAGQGALKAGSVVCKYACTIDGVSASLTHPWFDCCPGESLSPEESARVDGICSALLACVCASDSMRQPHVFAEAVRTIEDALANAD